jgi:hypothetical protein
LFHQAYLPPKLCSSWLADYSQTPMARLETLAFFKRRYLGVYWTYYCQQETLESQRNLNKLQKYSNILQKPKNRNSTETLETLGPKIKNLSIFDLRVVGGAMV